MAIITYLQFGSFLLSTALAGSLKDVKHVVLFMQENRAFDHYFGTMPGVRGFADPNVQVNSDGRTTFQQLVTKDQTDLVSQLTPWYINYLGGDWVDATQCMGAGSNSWQAMHEAYNGGLTNQWAASNTPYSIGFLMRSDIPTHFDIAEGWTVGDMYQEGILAATDPNRIIWMSGTVNNPGTPSNPKGDGGMILDNTATPGCEKPKLNCYPFTWKTVPEYWEDAGVTWQVYQDADNFDDNFLAYFDQHQKANKTSPLTTKGNSYIGLDKFYTDAKAGTLPQVSYIIGPAELSEHSPYLPSDGAWLQKQVVEAVVNGAAYNNTVLMISMTVGEYGDHVTPFHAPKDTPGEWINDPYGLVGDTTVGPGFRVPFSIISPWTRGGHVFTDHSKEIPPWRRQHMSNLIQAFDFAHVRIPDHGSAYKTEGPNYSLPYITPAPIPLQDPSIPQDPDGILGSLKGDYTGAAKCQAMYPASQPPVPYGTKNANASVNLLTEEGFKQIRGSLTEGRYLTLEMNGYALTNAMSDSHVVTGTKVTTMHQSLSQRWVVYQVGDLIAGNSFCISSAVDGRYIGKANTLTNQKGLAQTFAISYLSNGTAYALKDNVGTSLCISTSGLVTSIVAQSAFHIYSVTYHSG